MSSVTTSWYQCFWFHWNFLNLFTLLNYAFCENCTDLSPVVLKLWTIELLTFAVNSADPKFCNFPHRYPKNLFFMSYERFWAVETIASKQNAIKYCFHVNRDIFKVWPLTPGQRQFWNFQNFVEMFIYLYLMTWVNFRVGFQWVWSQDYFDYTVVSSFYAIFICKTFAFSLIHTIKKPGLKIRQLTCFLASWERLDLVTALSEMN